MNSIFELKDTLSELRKNEEAHLMFLTPFPDPVPFHFKIFRAAAYRRNVEKPPLPQWFETASKGWAKVTLLDTQTYHLIYTLFQILHIQGCRVKNAVIGLNEHMQIFSNWFHDLNKGTNAFYSSVHLHLAKEEFLPYLDDGTVDDVRLGGLMWLFFHLTDELHLEDESVENYSEKITTGWYKCSAALKEEINTVLDHILSVQAKKELFDIHLSMGYSESNTEELLTSLKARFCKES
jgi:hypothetical protein